MPGSRPFAAVGRMLSRASRDDDDSLTLGGSVSVVDRELAAESADADLSQDHESAETVPESAEDQDSEQHSQGVPHESGKLGNLVPKALEFVPPRHRWRSLLVAFLRLLFLTRSAPKLPASLAAVVAAIWAVVAGLILSLLVAVVAQVEQPITVAPWLWLAGHHMGFSTSNGVVTLLPLGLMLVCLLPLHRAGRFASRQFGEQTQAPVLLGLMTYVMGVAAVTLLWGSGQFSLVTAFVAGVICALVAGWWGWRRETGRTARSPILKGARWAVAVPLVLGVLVIMVGLVASWDAVVSVQSTVAVTTGEQVGLVLLQLAFLPNLVVWAGSYALGSGIAIGNETISPFADSAPAIPDLPILQILPTQSPDWTAMLPILVAFGAAMAAMRVQRMQPIHELSRRLIRALLLSGLMGVSWFVLSRLAGGSLGTEQLNYLGPSFGSAALAAVVCLAGTVIWALLPTIASDAKPVAIDLRDRVARKRDPNDVDPAINDDRVDPHA